MKTEQPKPPTDASASLHSTPPRELSSIVLVGNSLLDDEHQAILDELLHLIDLLHVPTRPDLADGVLIAFARLSKCLEVHFEHEESLLAGVAFPELERHAIIHLALKQAVRDTYRQFELEPGGCSVRDLAILLRDWWISHVNEVDARYASCAASPVTLRCPD